MPRFVILEHDHPALHWDFLLEQGERLKSFRLLSLPQGDEAVKAEALPPHRKLYLDYEGPVSGGRGSVTRIEEGEFESIVEDERRCCVTLFSRQWNGTMDLVQDENGDWTARFRKAPDGDADLP